MNLDISELQLKLASDLMDELNLRPKDAELIEKELEKIKNK